MSGPIGLDLRGKDKNMQWLSNFIYNLGHLREIWKETQAEVAEKRAKREEWEADYDKRSKEQIEAQHQLELAKIQFETEEFKYKAEHIEDYCEPEPDVSWIPTHL